MILVGISGKRGTGKSTLASILVKKHGFIEVSFAGPLKTAVQRDFNLRYGQTDGDRKEEKLANGFTPRDIMVMYGEFFRSIDPLYWIKKLFSDISYMADTRLGEKFVISDVRYENEAQAVIEHGGYLVRLNRSPKLNIYKDKSLAKDRSECALDSYMGWDLLITSEANKTPQDLEETADRIVERIHARK